MAHKNLVLNSYVPTLLRTESGVKINLLRPFPVNYDSFKANCEDLFSRFIPNSHSFNSIEVIASDPKTSNIS